MGDKRLGIVMNGVTGRMGMNQHLIRSIAAIRSQGGVTLKNGDRVMPDPDPRRPQRGEDCRSGQGARRQPLDHQSRQGTGRQERHRLLRRRHHADAPRPGRQGHRRGQAHLLREAGRDQPGRGAGARAQGQGRRHQARRGAGQAVPARPAQAQDDDRLRASSAACCRCAASSATGCSRATCSRRSGRPGTTAARTAAA